MEWAMTIKLYNTKTKSKDVFEPIDAENVRMYVCGPTVYDRAHLGNARPVVVFDTLFRLLRHTYGADHVTYVRNFTDVDDKINAKAAETERSIGDITDETIGWYHDDMDALGALRPTQEPRATAFIPQMVSMIQTLIKKGYAYTKPISFGHNSGAVHFDANKAQKHNFAQKHSFFKVEEDKNYGTLSGRSLDEMIAGSRAEVGEGKENPMDFVLWKPSSSDDPGWESPWGFGRPGWHIECSAMAKALLGNTFDIHGGGLDLQFPHHENEIAQSCCANDTDFMANYWLHNEMLQVEGKKMSKSLGNFFTVRDLLDQGIPGEVIRFVFLQTHYSKPMDWTAEKAEIARNQLKRLWSLAGPSESQVSADTMPSEVVDALENDLDTHSALQAVLRLAKEGRIEEMTSGAHLLGLLQHNENYDTLFRADWVAQDSLDAIWDAVYEWHNARLSKDYERSDFIRDGLTEIGVTPALDENENADWEFKDPDFMSDADNLKIVQKVKSMLGEE